MALTQISDVIVPAVYASYDAVNGPEKTAFAQSGVMVRVAPLDTSFDNGGRILTLPFWNDLDGSDEPNYSDDTTSAATPAKVGASSMLARMAMMNQGYSAADLAAALAGSDPIQHVRNRFGVYWQRATQRRLISTLKGVLADNIANDSADMVFNIANATANAVLVTDNYINRNAVIDAAGTMGDSADMLSAIAVHSAVRDRLLKNNEVDTLRDSENGEFQLYMGKRLIVDDNLPITLSGLTKTYTSVLFGAGAIGFGEGSPKVPVEIEREAAKGNGGGIETLWERKHYCIHPLGFSFTSSSVAGESATNAELATAANWNRVVSDRKSVPIAFLKTNG